MDFLQLAKIRYSVRKYKNQPVEKEKLQKILEAGRVAPTANNRQPQRVIIIQEPESLIKLSAASKTFGAPLMLIICGDQNEGWIRPYDNKSGLDIDTSIVATHMMLQATELGLGSVWIGNFNKEFIIEAFNLPSSVIPISILAIGYADREAKSPDRHNDLRKPIEQTTFYEMM